MTSRFPRRTLPPGLAATRSADPTVDLLAVYMDLREAMRNARILFRDLERREGARSVTIKLLASESRKAADAAQLLHDSNIGDIAELKGEID